MPALDWSDFLVVNSGSYVVLARKWRPAQFSDIVGQHHIVRTLMNAIRSQRIHQAYLFTGSRGIGKTSIARIFAKAIRCEYSTWAQGELGSGESQSAAATTAVEWLRSCGECASCKEIAAGTSVDVIEIDGASNNGVEAVREIRENAKYMPASGARKIYIIDEVHMLTTAAFNALLKTLEEPPPHVIFIFATTEPHKIPATILSRCQRFDYKRATPAQLHGLLARVTQAEKIQAEPAALGLIARAAEGSLRDSMSLLDQVIAFSGENITVQSVRDSIGLIEGQTLLGILNGVFARKPLDALALIEQAYQRGHDLRVLTRGLIEYLHGTVLARVGASQASSQELSSVSEEEWKELVAISELRPLEEIEMIFQVLHHGLEWIARSPQPKIVLDVLIVKCATAEALVYLDQANDANHTQTNAARPSTPATPATPDTRSAPVSEAAPPAVATTAANLNSRPATAPARPAINTQSAAVAVAPAPVPAPTTEPRATPPIIETPAIAPTSAGPRSWEGFIAHVRKSRPLLASMLEHAHCENIATESAAQDSLLTISYPLKDSYYKEQLGSRVYNEQLLLLSKEYFGQPMRIQTELRDGGESLAARKAREQKDRETTARTAALNHPTIVEAKSLFGGDLGPIELSEQHLNEGPHA